MKHERILVLKLNDGCSRDQKSGPFNLVFHKLFWDMDHFNVRQYFYGQACMKLKLTSIFLASSFPYVLRVMLVENLFISSVEMVLHEIQCKDNYLQMV